MPGDGSALGSRQPSATNSFAGVFARRRLAGQPSRRTRAVLRAGDTGFSLVELLLAAALTAIMGAMALMWLFTVNRTATDFTAGQQAENDLRHILELAVGEMADARPPARCDDDPPPADADSCQVWIDHWDVAAVGVPIYSANARQLCFYALAASGSPPDPSNTDPPALEGRCLSAKDDRLEIVIVDVDYDDQFVSTRPTPAADTDDPDTGARIRAGWQRCLQVPRLRRRQPHLGDERYRGRRGHRDQPDPRRCGSEAQRRRQGDGCHARGPGPTASLLSRRRSTQGPGRLCSAPPR